MAAGLPGKDATSLDASFCAVTIALGDVVEKFFSYTKLISAICFPEIHFRQCRSRVVLLRETRSKFCASWLGSAFNVLALLLAAGAASAAPCDIKNTAPPVIRHDLTYSFCEIYFYGHSTIIVTNPYQGVDMTDVAVVENLGSLALTFTSAQVSALRLLESRQDSNQFNAINVLAANNIVFQGGTLCLFASNNIFDFIIAGDFAACTSNSPWGDTHERYANTTVSLGGKIWT